MKTVREFIAELLEACQNDQSMFVVFDHESKGYIEPIAIEDGGDIAICGVDPED